MTDDVLNDLRELKTRVAALEVGGRDQGRLCPYCACEFGAFAYHERGDCDAALRARVDELEAEVEALRAVLIGEGAIIR